MRAPECLTRGEGSGEKQLDPPAERAQHPEIIVRAFSCGFARRPLPECIDFLSGQDRALPKSAGVPKFVWLLPSFQQRRAATCNCRCTCRKSSREGYPVDSDTQTLSTVMRIWAPILSNFKRTVLHCALASSVPANPNRRRPCISR